LTEEEGETEEKNGKYTSPPSEQISGAGKQTRVFAFFSNQTASEKPDSALKKSPIDNKCIEL
jgi:hypothetical protein